MTGHIYDNTRSIRQPRHTEVGERDDDSDNNEYEEDGSQDTRRDGDEGTKDRGEDEEEEEDEEEFETEDDISEVPRYMPKPTLTCQPIQPLLTRWNPPQ